jgi:hypothetical protein
VKHADSKLHSATERDGSQTVVVLVNNVPIGLVFDAQGNFTGFAFDVLPSLP